MPFYDRACSTCGREEIDVYEKIDTPVYPCGVMGCKGQMVRAWLTKPSNVIGDECDVMVKHGICHEDGTPRHYRFKSEMRAEAKRRGFENYVVHEGARGSDKSPHTSRWI